VTHHGSRPEPRVVALTHDSAVCYFVRAMSTTLNLTINGKEETTAAVSVLELLQTKRVEPNMVSVEYNGEILDRGAFPSTTLKPGDKIEFLYYMGGGAE